MNSKERYMLADKLWRVLELLQRVNLLADIDEEDFMDNKARCLKIREVIDRLNEGVLGAINDARVLASEYQGIFEDVLEPT